LKTKGIIPDTTNYLRRDSCLLHKYIN